MMSTIVGLTTIGTVSSANRSQGLFGFWIPKPIILGADEGTEGVTAGSRTWSWPNPFRENVSIEVQLSGSTVADADVFNSVGEHVATLPVAMLRDDAATFTWDGLTSLGTPIASGSYTVRISVTEPLRQRRIMYSTTITRIR